MADRDVLVPKHPTPPAGVKKRAESEIGASADDFSDEEASLTPVGGMSYEAQAAGRAKQAATASRVTAKMVKRLQGDQATLARSITDYAETDRADHAIMKEQIADIGSDVKELTQTVSITNTHVANIAGKMDVLLPDIQLDKMNKAYEARISLRERSTIRTSIWKAVVKAFGAALLAGSVAAAGYFTHSCTHQAAPSPSPTPISAPEPPGSAGSGH